MSNEPWYAPGLQFQCTQCGDCCTGSPGFVWVSDDELAAIAAHLGRPVGEVRLLDTRPAQGKTSLREYPNGDCLYFNPATRGCNIYPVRPKQCRTWPFWRQNISTPEGWARTCQSCPGAGKGTFVPWEDVARTADETGI
jgi:Fe-S-cluster containining protein